MRRGTILLACLYIVFWSLGAVTHAAQFAGGTGTADDPYQIATAAQLISIGSDPNLLDRHFVLTADIDLDPGRRGGKIFTEPVIPCASVYRDGSWEETGFSGSFEGAGHTIKNLTITSPEAYCTGLFEQIAGTGLVSDLVLSPVSIDCSDGRQVGALAGENLGTILNCRVSGNVSAEYTVGGLVGRNSGTIRGCSANCRVAGVASIGGLVGDNSVLRSSDSSGVLIECSMAEGTVTKADVSRRSYNMGGLAGISRGTVANCFAATSVTGDEYIGGLIGACDGSVVCCYACGEVGGLRGEATVGGLIGISGTPEKSQIVASYFLTPPGSPSQVNGLGTALTDAQMRQAASFVGWDFAGTLTDGFAETWIMPEDGGYPTLSTLSGYEPPRPPGSGTTDDPYRLSQVEELPTMVRNPDACYRLIADINFVDVPVIGPVVPSFSGWLDGSGHSFANLYITANEGGFLGNIERGAVVENLRFDGASLEATADTAGLGILAQMNCGLVRNCHVTGIMTGTDSLGGLVGINNGVLWACSADVQATGMRFVGGLAGKNAGGVIACAHTHGSTQGTYYVGGLVGYNSYGIVWRCYSTCLVALSASAQPTSWPNTTLGGLVGAAYAQQVYESYYLAPAASWLPVNEFGTALSEAQLRDPASFVGWDFFGSTLDGTRDVWYMGQGAFPILSCETEQTPLGLIVRVRGQSLEDAAAHLMATGHRLGEVRYDFDGAVPAGCVIAVQVGADSAVDVLASLGTYSWGDDAADGTPANPYEIATAGQLDCLGRDPSLWERCFVLTADIDLGVREYPGPILAPDLDQGTNEFQGIAFTGRFDGQGHTIRGLTIVSAQTYVGLFGGIGAAADVSGLNLEDVLVIGDADTAADVRVDSRQGTGALAGANASNVSDCHVNGTVLGTQNTGGLVGDNMGSVTRSSAVSVVHGFSFVGGLVSVNRAGLAESWTDTQVSGNDQVGGLVGRNEDCVARCFTRGEVMGMSEAGGLAGRNAGTVTDCFSSAGAQGRPESVGGLVGSNWGTVNRCYSVGPVENLQGGLVGRNSAVVNQSFWDTQTSGAPGSNGGAGRTSDQMHKADTFVGWGDAWVIQDGIGYPQLAWTAAAGTPIRNLPDRSYRGSGDPNDPFVLATPPELVCFLARAEDWSGAVELGGDIDMAGVQTQAMIGTFTGTLDGKGHCIRNLTLSGADGSVGLIDQLEGGTIQNLQLIDVQIGGAGSYIGALAAKTSKATISCCRVTGRITTGDGVQCVGGLVGKASETDITCCAAEVNISAGSGCQYVGGLAGICDQGTTVRDCYARGTVAGMDQCRYFGGLIGGTGYAIVQRCYAAARVTMVGETSGGFRGNDLGTCTVTTSFWDRDVSPDSKGCGARSTAAMQAPSIYLDEQWDLAYEKDNGTADLWIIPATGGYPELTCFMEIPEPPSLPGLGTPADPYRIASVEDLLAIQRVDLSACYVLCEDLDFGGRILTSAPVPSFNGRFLGNGHTISNLYIVGDLSLGVFASLLTNATVSDLNVEDVNVAGTALGLYIGALAGRNHGKVINCRATGLVTSGDDSAYIGGLIGENTGPLVDCRADVRITVQNRCRYIGGLAGWNEGPVRTCRATTDLQAGDATSCVGGLIGSNIADLFLSESTGRISAGNSTTSLGGLVGFMGLATDTYHTPCDIIDCRADMCLAGLADCNGVGGLVGDFVGAINRCYARGSITLGNNPSNAGGLVGRLRAESAVPASFWCVEGDLTHSDGGNELTPAEMRDPNQFLSAGWDFAGAQANGTSDLWIMPQDANGPRPVVFMPGYQRPPLSGKGTADDPYLIATAQDLGAVNHYGLSAHFRLVENLDLSAIEWSESPIWCLYGSLDGGRLQITGLRIRQAPKAGLVRRVAVGAEVNALTIADANVAGGAILAYYNDGNVADCRVSGHVLGSQYVGGLVAFSDWSRGSILRCCSTATVTGTGSVGGLVGHNSAKMYQCFAAGSVSGEGKVGGLAGSHDYGSRIHNCYVRGSVRAEGYGGGLIGYAPSFSVYRCYAANSVSGTGDIGALVSNSSFGTVFDYSRHFWDAQVSGVSSEQGTGLETAQMQMAQTFLDAGWDFVGETANGTDDIWWIDEGRDYPRLWWELDEEVEPDP